MAIHHQPMHRCYRPRRTLSQMIDSAREAGRDVQSPVMIGHGTFQYTTPDGSRCVRYHDTDIVTAGADGSLAIDAGYFGHSAMCRARINEALCLIGPKMPEDGRSRYRLYSSPIGLKLDDRIAEENIFFRSSILIGPTGGITRDMDEAEMKAEKKALQKYLKQWDEEGLPPVDSIADDVPATDPPTPSMVRGWIESRIITRGIFRAAVRARNPFNPDARLSLTDRTGWDRRDRAAMRTFLKKTLGMP